jgi:ubiquinone/menaquinone biosynthesis C-methylase UbiE
MPFDHFGWVAGIYDHTTKFCPSRQLLELMSLQSESHLLDVGGGTGRVADALKDMVRKTVIADFSQGMLRYAIKKRHQVVCSMAEKLPFPSFKFDRIIMVDTFHHLSDQDQTIKELWRVLAPGGKIIIIEPDIHKISIKLLAIGEKILLMRSHFLSAEVIASKLANQTAEVRIVTNESNVWVCAERVR